MKKIVIIGAGYSGVLTAKKLAKKYKNAEETQITIIDKNPYHTMLTELHEVAAGRVDEESIRISLKKVFAGRNVNVVLDTAASVDLEKKIVICEGGNYSYDRLVIASGSKPTHFGTKGAREYAYGLWSYDDAIRLRDRIEDCFRRAASIRDVEERKKLLSFFVVGAGFTGVEMAGELAEYVPILCHKYEMDRELVTIFDVDVLPRTVNIMTEKISAKVQRRLEKMGVNVQLQTGVVEIGEDYIDLKKDDEITRHVAGTVMWTAGIESSDIAGGVARELTQQGRGRIQTNEFLQAEGQEDVFVVGDNLFFIPEGEQAPVPQMVENGEQSAHTAAHNIIASFQGEAMKSYKPAFHGVMVCIGGRYGVARVGTPKHMFSLASFFAMFAKHFINIIYFIQVLGWNKIFSYVKHEFFTVRHHRSFVGGHFSNVTPSFLLVPLRVWLGAVWAFEGVMKIVEGWMVEPKLTGFFGGASAWYEGIINPGAATTGASTAVADAVTAATGEVASGAADAVAQGVSLINWDFLGLFQVMFVSGKSLDASTIADYAMKINVPFMNTLLDNTILASDGMQIFMQAAIVIVEICIGLALMGGLLTFPAAAVSLILQVMFLTTTGLYLSTFWMIFAGLAVLIGAGRTFGLDYYAMPKLKDRWSKTRFARKWYLYND